MIHYIYIAIFMKKGWKTIKPFLSDKILSKEKLTLIEKDETVKKSIINRIKILQTFLHQ